MAILWIRKVFVSFAAFVLFCLVSVTGAMAMEVVANGLNNPRKIAFGPDGALYIAEAGLGGEGVCVESPTGIVCYGASGAITRVLEGQQERILTGLPSFSGEDGDEGVGPHDILVAQDGGMYILIGLGNDPTVLSDPEGLNNADSRFAKLLYVGVDGEVTEFADFAGFEIAVNPDGAELDTNAFGMAADGDGFVVADAGSNAVLLVNADGEISTLAVFPDRQVPPPPFLPQDPPTIPMEAVPTCVAIGPDGAYYIGQLTGFPFPVGGANIYRVEAGGEPEVFAGGFTNVVDLKFDEDGNLYVLEIRKSSLLSNDLSGSVRVISPSGDIGTVIENGLIMPTGMAFGADGLLYIAHNMVDPNDGQVVRINPQASAVSPEIWLTY